ncbi:MAG: GPR1/FUN34/YaaH family transporter [Myxococcota bacterium]|jgi:succinate-acetate transporter protein|nr:GPR1/FUN34/YaaH family transporter [Myxococcota bacterium]
MVSKVNISTPHTESFGNPAPLGLLGLAVGCASLVPIALGYGLTPGGLLTASTICLLFGGFGQLFTGLMEMRNRNTFGGVIFTLFAFQWAMNAWELHAYATGVVPDHHIKLAVEVTLLIILVPLTFGFGFFSKLLFWFLIDIDLLFVAKIIKALSGTTALDYPIVAMTIFLGGIAIYIALAALINPIAGRQVFRISGPLFNLPKKPSFDWSLRYNLFGVLYQHWRENGFEEMPVATLEDKLQPHLAQRKLLPDLQYLSEFGYLQLSLGEDGAITSVRLNAKGIDLHEQLVLRKYD